MTKSKKSNKGNHRNSVRKSYESKSKHIYRRGNVYYADLGECVGSEQSGLRPVVILQTNEGKSKTTTITVACMTTKDKGRPMRFHVEVDSIHELKDSYVLCEHIRTIEPKDLITYIYRLSDEEMAEVSKAIKGFLKLQWNNITPDKVDTSKSIFKRGDVYNVDISNHIGKGEGTIAPCVILQNDVANMKSATLVVACVGENGVIHEEITTVDKLRVSDYLYKLDDEEMKDVSYHVNKSLDIRW